MLGRFILAASLTIGLAPATVLAEEPAAWSVEAVTHSGVRYSGVLVRTAKTAELFRGSDQAEVGPRFASTRVELKWFNGLSGSIGLKVADLRSMSRVGSLSHDELKERTRTRTMSTSEKWVKERTRLAKISEGRANRATEAAGKAATAAEEAAAALDAKMTEEQRAWLEKFHPDQGWIPAKKESLYHQSVILNSTPLTDQDREWLDHYNEWKPAYDLWLDAEKKKIAAEKAAEEAGQLVSDADRASATARSGAASIDPDHPTPEDAAKLPIPLQKDVPKPEKVEADAPKPVPVSESGG